jgi:two-component system response regulator PilR (NtrC family)
MQNQLLTPDPAIQAKRILVVDDEEKLGRFVSMLLQRSGGYDVATCNSVAEARQLLEEGPFSLVITDIVMPNETGLQLVQWLTENYPDLPCVVMTAHSNRVVDQQAVQLGATDVLHKPFALDALQQLVDRILVA